MPCKNADCERNKWSDAQMLNGTIAMLEQQASMPSCVGCSMQQLASWLRELRALRHEHSRALEVWNILNDTDSMKEGT